MVQKLALFGGTPAIQYPHPHADRRRLTPDDRSAIAQFLDGNIAPLSYFGREGLLAEYEDALAAFFGRRHCILTNSGTNALHSAFFAAGIEPGDEVVAPVYTFHSTVTPLLQLGAVPVLVDVCSDTGNIDPVRIVAAITPATRGIVATHMWGHPFDGSLLRSIADEHGLVLIEDVSLAVGSTLGGRQAGAFGHIACLSLGSTKLLSGGQGGALLTDDDTLWERATLIGHFGARALQCVYSEEYRPFAPLGFGQNYRIHPLAVAISFARFRRLSELIAMRHERLEALTDLLKASGLCMPLARRDNVFLGSWQGFCAQVPPSNAQGLSVIVNALNAEGVEAAAHGYYPPLHFSRTFQATGEGLRARVPYASNRRRYSPGEFPVVEEHVGSLIGFPLFLDEPLALIEAYGRACRKVADSLQQLERFFSHGGA